MCVSSLGFDHSECTFAPICTVKQLVLALSHQLFFHASRRFTLFAFAIKTMRAAWCTLFSLYVCVIVATTTQDARALPHNFVHAKATPIVGKDVPAPHLDRATSLDIVPDLVFSLKVDYVKEFLALKSASFHTATDTVKTAPLSSKFTNLERTLSDEGNLRSWTRFIVDHDWEDFEITPDVPSEASVDLEIDEFITYLVTHRGFRSSDLQFLHRKDLDYGYDQITEELAKIKERYAEPKNIDVSGGQNASPSLRAPLWMFCTLFIPLIY